MSFGFGVGDFIQVAQLVKGTLDSIKSAPEDFKDAERTVQSLDILFDSVKLEVESTTSIFRRDPAQAEQFSNLIKLCQAPLTKLNDLLGKYASLGTDNKKVLHRARFSKKAVLELKGEISLRCANLSAFLDTVGLGGLGRLEHKVDSIRDVQSSILDAIDRAVAEARLKRNTASYLSDHTNDDKAVWKQLRRDLNKAGFKSADVERHKAVICDKLKELQQYGLLDWDTASAAETDTESVTTFIAHEKRRYKPPAVKTVHGGSEGGNDCCTIVESTIPASEPPSYGEATTSSTDTSVLRVWRGRQGNINLKARLERASVEHVYLRTTDNEEILIPVSNLSQEESEYIAGWKQLKTFRRDSKMKAAECRKRISPKSMCVDSTASHLPSHPDYDRETLSGHRDTRPPSWRYRPAGDILPNRKQSSNMHDDNLPSAAAKGDIVKVRRLLERGANIESIGPMSYSYREKDSDGDYVTKWVHYPETTALYRAIDASLWGTAKLLLMYGADPNVANKEGCMLLRKLVEDRKCRLLRLLLEYGGDANSQGVLREAARSGQTAIVRALLEHSAEIERPNQKGETALYCASWEGHAKVVDVLLREGASVNHVCQEGQSPLYKAAGQGHDKVVELLLQYDANPAVGRGKAGETVLFKACRLGHERTVRLLLRRGANPDVENDFKRTQYGSKGELLMHLLRPTEPAKNEYGQRPLYAAARLGHLEIVRLLLDYGADVNARTEDGLPPVYIAAQMGHEDVARLLLDSGAQLVDPRFIDPVARLMESDDHDSIRGFDDEADSKRKLKGPFLDSKHGSLLAAFKKHSLQQGGDGLKTIAKMAGANGENWQAKMVPLLGLGVGLLAATATKGPITNNEG